MIKKTTIAALGMLAAFMATARTVTPEEALNRLRSDNKAMKAASAVATKPTLVHTSFTAEGTPATYIFNSADNNGFMILPADDVAAPLLGYGDTGVTSDAMPPQLVWWLGEYANEIEAAKAPLLFVKEPAAAAKAPAAAERKSIAPMLKTRWNQDAPYNNLCPRDDDQATYTGCVATAMAQIMKYFNYPDKGTGSGSCTVSNKYGVVIETQTMDLNVDLKWSDMLDSYSGNYTAQEGEAVATLMKACGYSVAMNYTTEASGAQTNAVPVALVDNFGYDKACQMLERIHYPLEEWEQMVYENLRDCGPVYYSGQAIEGGHAFVCDGYSADGMFHFNWGWGGAFDGYFRLTALEPAGQGIGGFSGGYNTEQCAIMGIRKPVEGSQFPQLQLTQISTFTADEDGSRVLLKGPWVNYNGRVADVAFAVEFEPVDGGEKYMRQIFNYSEIPVFLGLNQIAMPKSYMSSLANGSYKVRVLTQGKGYDEWLPMLHNINIPDYVVITKNGGTLTYENPEPDLLTCVSAEFDIPFCFYTRGKMTVEMKNETGSEVPANLSVALIEDDGAVVARSGGSFFDLLAGQEETRTFEFALTISDDFKWNSTYGLILYDTMSGRILKQFGTIDTTMGEQPVIVCDEFVMEGSTTEASLDNITFYGTFSCTQAPYADDIVIGIFPSVGGNAITSQIGDQTLFLNTGESGNLDFHLDLSYICHINTYYLALPYYITYRLIMGELKPQLTPAASETQVIRFKATQYSGIEIVEADEAGLQIYHNPALNTAIVNGPAAITEVAVYTAAGAMIPVNVAADGTTATIDLSTVPAGITIVRATDAEGNTVTSKLMVR